MSTTLFVIVCGTVLAEKSNVTSLALKKDKLNGIYLACHQCNRTGSQQNNKMQKNNSSWQPDKSRKKSCVPNSNNFPHVTLRGRTSSAGRYTRGSDPHWLDNILPPLRPLSCY